MEFEDERFTETCVVIDKQDSCLRRSDVAVVFLAGGGFQDKIGPEAVVKELTEPLGFARSSSAPRSSLLSFLVNISPMVLGESYSNTLPKPYSNHKAP